VNSGVPGKFYSFGYTAEQDYAKMCEDSTHAEYRYFSKFKMRLYQPECGANKGNMRGKVSEFWLKEKAQKNKQRSTQHYT
jgi:hypothetical protein